MIAVLALSWIQALAPPIHIDALSYHLEIPKQFIWKHRINMVPFTRESLWPFQTEMLFTLGLLIEGTTLAQLFHWFFYPLTVSAVYLLGQRMVGEKTAAFSALIFMATPAVFAQSGHSYVDLSFAFYTLTALFPLLIYLETNDSRLAFLSGLCAGAAAGTKMLGLGSAAILCVLWAFSSRSGKQALRYTTGVLLTGSIWYFKSWIESGNPVYPFFSAVFGSGYQVAMDANVGMEGGLVGFAKLLWNMTMYPRSFGGEMLGVLFCMFVPLLIFRVACMTRRAAYLLVFVIAYTYFLYTQSQHLRFYLSVAPFLSIGAAYSLQTLMRETAHVRRTVIILFMIILLIYGGIFVYRVRNLWSVVAGKTSPVAYLEHSERSFKAFRYIKDHVRDGESLLVWGEVRLFYCPIKTTTFDCGPLRDDLKKQGVSFDKFLDKRKFNYMLIQTYQGRPADETLLRYIENNSYLPVCTYESYEKPVYSTHTVYYKNYH